MNERTQESRKDATQNMRENILALNRESLAVQFDLVGSDFEAVENIGSGAYGVVCSAINRKSGARVAIKKISEIFAQPTIAMRTYREIKILRHLKHDNVIGIKNILHTKEHGRIKDIYIVFTLMETDLHRIIYSKQTLSLEHVRYFIYQIVRGLKFIHSANILHRDLKPSNLLVNENCDLKIGDFGMARGISSKQPASDDESERRLTHYVATRWYRAPELLLQFPVYSASVDMWSLGCILAELINRKTLFPGRNMLHQLELIFNFAGIPSMNYVDMSFSDKIKRFIKFKHELNRTLQEDISFRFPGARNETLNLLYSLLQLDSNKRLSADEVLEHPFLQTYHDASDEPTCPRLFDFTFEQEFNKYSGAQNVQKLCEVLENSIAKEIERFERFRDLPVLMMAMAKSGKAPDNKRNQWNISDEMTADTEEINYNDDDDSGYGTRRCSSENKDIEGSEQLLLMGDITQDDQIQADTLIQEDKLPNDDCCLQSVTETTASNKSKLTKVCVASKNPDDVDMLSAKLGSATIKDVDMPSPVVSFSTSPSNLNLSPASIQSQMETEFYAGEKSTMESINVQAPHKELPSSPSENKDRSEIAWDLQPDSQSDKASAGPSHQENTVLDAKAKIKAALLLSSEMKKERMKSVTDGTKYTKHSVTAIQRQREREEKRRLKQERALKRKEKSKDGHPRHPALSDELSSDDKKLLERWNNMQKHLTTQSCTSWSQDPFSYIGDTSEQQILNSSDRSFVPLLPIRSYHEGSFDAVRSSNVPFAANTHQSVQFSLPPFNRNSMAILTNENVPIPPKDKSFVQDITPERPPHRVECVTSAPPMTFAHPQQICVNSLPTISTILQPAKTDPRINLKISKEAIKLPDTKESQGSAPLSATILADWIEMTKEIDQDDLEAFVLDYEHDPTEMNLLDINYLLLH